MDINLVKIDKIIDINKAKPVSFKQFSVSIIPATASAAGFDLTTPTNRFSMLNWFMTLKLVNASRENLIIENIQAEWIGRDNHRCKSDYVEICEAIQENKKDEAMIVDQLIDEKKSLERKSIFLPIFLKHQSEKFIRVDFLLKTYKRTLLNYWRPISFRKDEIKAPEIYEQLLQKAIIKIMTDRNRKPLLLKI